MLSSHWQFVSGKTLPFSADEAEAQQPWDSRQKSWGAGGGASSRLEGCVSSYQRPSWFLLQKETSPRHPWVFLETDRRKEHHMSRDNTVCTAQMGTHQSSRSRRLGSCRAETRDTEARVTHGALPLSSPVRSEKRNVRARAISRVINTHLKRHSTHFREENEK